LKDFANIFSKFELYLSMYLHTTLCGQSVNNCENSLLMDLWIVGEK
jgi:hypothetical protein